MIDLTTLPRDHACRACRFVQGGSQRSLLHDASEDRLLLMSMDQEAVNGMSAYVTAPELASGPCVAPLVTLSLRGATGESVSLTRPGS